MIEMRTFLIILAAFAATSCGDPKGRNPAAAPDLPRPGKYEIASVDESVGSGKQLREPTTKLRCVNRADLKDPMNLFLGERLSSCHDEKMAAADGEISLEMRCDAPDGDLLNIPIEGRGTYDKDGWEIAIDMQLYGVTTRGTETARRIGDC